MMEFLFQLGLFASKTFLIVVALLVVIAFILLSMNRTRGRAQLEIEKLNERFDLMRETMNETVLSKKALKTIQKLEKKKKETKDRRRVFVLKFEGDIKASEVDELREEITAILSIAGPGDEIIAKIESPGGMVSHYGLAASQLKRIREQKVKLTVCVDKVAASGGYLMACVADQILAAPFAIVGSIGVVASVPNLHRLLNKHDIDYREITAGEYKRTVSIFGEITPQGLEKFKQQIQETHELFKHFVEEHRPQLKLEHIATGEYWYGAQAVGLHLVDKIQTSDDYIFQLAKEADVYKVNYQTRKRLSEKLSESLGQAAQKAVQKVYQDLVLNRFEH